MTIEFSREAKERIASLGPAEVTKFIEELPQSLLRNVFRALPKVDGFRRNSIAEFKEKQKRFVMHLTHHSQSKVNHDWFVFAKIWEIWGKEHLETTLPEIDSGCDGWQNAKNFFRELIDIAPQAPREDVERLYLFSGFENSDEVQFLVSQFKSKSEIKRDQLVTELPKRLKHIEDKLKKAESSFRESDALHAEAESEFDSIERKFNDIQLDLSEASRKFQQSEHKLESSFTALSNSQSQLEADIKDLSVSLSKIEQELTSIGKQLQSQKYNSDVISDLYSTVNELESKYESFFSKLKDDNGKEIQQLSEKLAMLENQVEKNDFKDGGMVSHQSAFNKLCSESITVLNSVTEACEAISLNLQAIGFVKRDANSIVRQIVAALSLGQVVQFTGALSDLTAEAVSLAIGGKCVLEWNVPVGLTDCSYTKQFLAEAASCNAGCLVLKGVNLSAFEVYGSPIRDMVLHRQFSLPTRNNFPVVASVRHGAAVFPNGGSISELGPVINTDDLKVRAKSSKSTDFTFGELNHTELKVELEHQKRTVHDCLDELNDIIQDVDFHGGNLWVRSVTRAYQTMRRIPGGAEDTDLYSILMLWSLPWAEYLGAKTEDIILLAKRDLLQTEDEEMV